MYYYFLYIHNNRALLARKSDCDDKVCDHYDDECEMVYFDLCAEDFVDWDEFQNRYNDEWVFSLNDVVAYWQESDLGPFDTSNLVYI